MDRVICRTCIFLYLQSVKHGDFQFFDKFVRCLYIRSIAHACHGKSKFRFEISWYIYSSIHHMDRSIIPLPFESFNPVRSKRYSFSDVSVTTPGSWLCCQNLNFFSFPILQWKAYGIKVLARVWHAMIRNLKSLTIVRCSCVLKDFWLSGKDYHQPPHHQISFPCTD